MKEKVKAKHAWISQWDLKIGPMTNSYNVQNPENRWFKNNDPGKTVLGQDFTQDFV